MKVVQTRLQGLEYDLLRKRAKRERRPMQDVVRDAIRAHVMTDSVDPDEPIFTELPPMPVRKGTDRSSEHLDDLLYGKGP